MPIFLTFGAVKIFKIHNNHKIDMKKVILGVAVAGLVISCQKVQESGNKGVLKMESGVERYNDDVMSDEATAKYNEAQDAKLAAEGQVKAVVKKDSVQENKTVETTIPSE